MGEARAELGDRMLRLAMDNEAWMEVEQVLDTDHHEIIQRLYGPVKKGRARRSVPTYILRALLFGATRQHHGELTLQDCQQLLEQEATGKVIGPALGKALWGSVAPAEESPGEAKPPVETPGEQAQAA